MVIPNFIIGGTAAGGTSFLSSILTQHPQIYLPKEMRPEPHFFYKSWEFEKGIDYYHSRWFSNVLETALAVGERSSSYLFGGEKVAKRISDFYPNIKFIVTLRNPVERAWANYRYTVLSGYDNLTFEEAIMKEPERIKEQKGIWSELQPHNYTGRGFYAKQIRSFLKHFSKDQFLFVKSELLSKQTDIELQKIYGFLNLSELDFKFKSVPNFTSVSVINPQKQFELKKYFADSFDKLVEASRKGERIENYFSQSFDKMMMKELSNNMTNEKKQIPDSIRQYLGDLFSDDISDLENFVDFDLSDWK